MRVMVLASVLVLALTGMAMAADPPDKQADRLLELSQQAANLSNHRDATERKLAVEQVKVYRLMERVKELQAQLDEAKKAQEKPAEKKSE